MIVQPIMKAITLVLFNRPKYTRAVIEALRKCNGIGDYLILPHIEPGNDEVIALAKSIDFAKTKITLNKEILGIAQNTYHAWSEGFKRSDFIIHLEDDTIPAPDCLKYMEHCSKVYQNDKGIFSVSAYNRQFCRKSQFYQVSRRNPFTCWIFGLWKNRWNWIKGNWSKSHDLYAVHLTNELIKYQLKEVYPLLSRCQNIGVEDGVHVPSADWHEQNQHTKYWAGNHCLPSKNYWEHGPLVTAVMVTGMHRSRYALAKVAIECFKKQTYSNKELLIVNHGPESLFCNSQFIREIRVKKQKVHTVGDLRNIGLSCASGDFIINWDDDDWHHPRRIELQMAAQKNNAAVLLKNRIHYSLKNHCANYSKIEKGAAATILHPKKIDFHYPSLIRGSDSVFASCFDQQIAIENDPSLYVRFFHGLNLWDAKHIMGPLAHRSSKNELRVDSKHRQLLARILPLYQNFLK